MLLSFSRLWIWDRLRDALPWYYDVSTNRMPAKYLIAGRVPCNVDLNENEDALWSEHAKATEAFLRIWKEIRSGQKKLNDFEKESPSLMDLSVELVKRMLTHCNFCRWNCRVDRSEGAKHGTCQLESPELVHTSTIEERNLFSGEQEALAPYSLRRAICVAPSVRMRTYRETKIGALE